MEPVDEDTPMVVTDCDECLGDGYVQEAGEAELACSNPKAFWNEADRHVVPVEALEDDPEDEEDDEPEVPVESGPEAGGMVPVGEAAPTEAATEAEGLDWPDDVVGVVTVGDDDGLAHVVTRSLSGIEGPFTEQMAEVVNEFRESLGLDEYPEDVVVGKLWAMFLPVVKVGATGQVAQWLCKALELPVKNVVDVELMTAAITKANPELIEDIGPDEIADYEFDCVDWLEIL